MLGRLWRHRVSSDNSPRAVASINEGPAGTEDYKSMKGFMKAIVLGSVLAGLAGGLSAVRAADAPKVQCDVTKDGKTETKEVASADECKKMGGTVHEEHKK